MSGEPTPRELALSILLEVTAEKEYCHIAIRNVLDKYAYLPAQQRAQVKRLSEGTMENLILLDEIIGQFSSTPVKKLKPVIKNILRMAVYEFLYMDSVPERATVSEAVRLAERKGFRNLKGFVNGVLRNIARDLPELTFPDAVSIRYSMPEWIVTQWEESYGAEKTEAICKGFSGEAPLTVRVVTARRSEEEIQGLWREEGVEFCRVEDVPGAYTLTHFDRLERLRSFQEGDFFVQDISSMKALQTIPLKEGMEILDLCGAPGGKSLFLAEKLSGTGKILCRDVSEKKTALIRENISRCGFKNLRAQAHDALLTEEELIEKMDLVVADLPCSGLGVLSRKPDIRYRQSIESEKELAALQRRILAVAERYVKQGGCLFYSTCTIDRMENEDNARWFVQTFPGFEKESEAQLFPEARVQDGFYFALFRRKA